MNTFEPVGILTLYFLKCILIILFHQYQGFVCSVFLWNYPDKILYAFLLSQCVLHALSTSYLLIKLSAVNNNNLTTRHGNTGQLRTYPVLRLNLKTDTVLLMLFKMFGKTSACSERIKIKVRSCKSWITELEDVKRRHLSTVYYYYCFLNSVYSPV